jgi:hypothetical protein
LQAWTTSNGRSQASRRMSLYMHQNAPAYSRR